MTFTLELPDAVMQSLKVEAEKQHMALNEWIVIKLQRDLEVESSTRHEVASDDEFQNVANSVIQRNTELLRRLA